MIPLHGEGLLQMQCKVSHKPHQAAAAWEFADMKKYPYKHHGVLRMSEKTYSAVR